MFPALVLALLTQADNSATRALEEEANRSIDATALPNPAEPTASSPPPSLVPTKARVRLESTVGGAKLLELPEGRPLCDEPCGLFVPSTAVLEYGLAAAGRLDSKAFSLEGGTAEVKVWWRPASPGLRVLGIVLSAVGGAAYLAGVGMGVVALWAYLNYTYNFVPPYPSLEWAWPALPLGLGGFAVLAAGMTVLFRFGVERLTVEVAPPPPTSARR